MNESLLSPRGLAVPTIGYDVSLTDHSPPSTAQQASDHDIGDVTKRGPVRCEDRVAIPVPAPDRLAMPTMRTLE